MSTTLDTTIFSPNLTRPSGFALFDPRRADVDSADRQRQFASVLSIAQRRPGAKPSDEQQARESAEQLVAIALVQPLLAQLRSADNAAPPFQATQGEKQFRSLWDAQIAGDLVRASNFPLVDRIAESMLRAAPKLPEETER